MYTSTPDSQQHTEVPNKELIRKVGRHAVLRDRLHHALVKRHGSKQSILVTMDGFSRFEAGGRAPGDGHQVAGCGNNGGFVGLDLCEPSRRMLPAPTCLRSSFPGRTARAPTSSASPRRRTTAFHETGSRCARISADDDALR